MKAFVCDRCGKAYTVRSVVLREAIQDHNRTIKLPTTNEEIEGIGGIALNVYNGQGILRTEKNMDLCPECVSLLNKFFMNKNKEVSYERL